MIYEYDDVHVYKHIEQYEEDVYDIDTYKDITDDIDAHDDVEVYEHDDRIHQMMNISNNPEYYILSILSVLDDMSLVHRCIQSYKIEGVLSYERHNMNKVIHNIIHVMRCIMIHDRSLRLKSLILSIQHRMAARSYDRYISICLHLDLLSRDHSSLHTPFIDELMSYVSNHSSFISYYRLLHLSRRCMMFDPSPIDNILSYKVCTKYGIDNTTPDTLTPESGIDASIFVVSQDHIPHINPTAFSPPVDPLVSHEHLPFLPSIVYGVYGGKIHLVCDDVFYRLLTCESMVVDRGNRVLMCCLLYYHRLGLIEYTEDNRVAVVVRDVHRRIEGMCDGRMYVYVSVWTDFESIDSLLDLLSRVDDDGDDNDSMMQCMIMKIMKVEKRMEAEVLYNMIIDRFMTVFDAGRYRFNVGKLESMQYLGVSGNEITYID